MKKKLLSLVLVLTMVISLMPSLALNVSAANGKGLFSLVYLQPKADAAATEFAFEETAKKETYEVGDIFYVGVKMSDLTEISSAASTGFRTIGIGVNYNDQYLELEPTLGDMLTSYGMGSVKDAANKSTLEAWLATGNGDETAGVPGRFFGRNTIFPYFQQGMGKSIRYNFSASEKTLEPNDTGYDNSKFRTLVFTWQTAAAASAAGNQTTDDAYVIVLEFRVKAVPADGESEKVLGFSHSGSNVTVSYGVQSNGTYGSVQYDKTGAASDILNVFDFDETAVDIFPSTYDIVYDDNAGAGKQFTDLTATVTNDGDETVKAGDTITNLPSGTATHTDGASWAVTSWNTAADGSGTTIVAGTTVITDDMANEEGKIILYAQWEQKFALTFDGNGGKTDDGLSVVTEIIDTNTEGSPISEAVDVPTFTRTGDYSTANTWYEATDIDGTLYYITDGKSPVEFTSTNVSGSKTYFIDWVSTADPEDQATVIFDPNGGTYDDTVTVTVNKGESINATAATGENMPVPPTRTGYVFDSWNTQANGGGTAFDGTTKVGEDVTVYAQWTVADGVDKWTVTFHVEDGATVTPDKYEVAQDAANGVSVTASLIPTATREGYVATEWYIASGDDASGWSETTTKYDTSYTINGNIDVVPHWEKALTINLHPDGKKHVDGDGDPDLLTITAYGDKKLSDSPDYDEDDIQDKNRPGNYVLMGWSTEPQWGNDTYAFYDDLDPADQYDADTVIDAATMDGIDLYAWWEIYVSVTGKADGLVYNGKEQTWDDTLAAKAVDFNTNAAGDDDPITLKVDDDYTVEIYTSEHDDGADHEEAAATGFKEVGDYCVHFTSVNPELVFDPEQLSLSVAKAKVKLEITPTVPASDEDPEAPPVLPEIKVTLGDDPLDPEDEDEQKLIEDILKELNFVYYRMADGTNVDTGATISAADLAGDWADTKSNPYLAGDYVVAVQPGDDCGYELDSTAGFVVNAVEGADKVLNFTNSDPRLATDWQTDLNTQFDPNTSAFLLHVTANSRKVTFQQVKDMETDKTLETIGEPVTVKNGAKIDDELAEGVTTNIPEYTKPDNYEFVGWYILPEGMTTYDALAADVNGETPTADEFTKDTEIKTNMTVVAVFKSSTDSGLKDPDPEADPENPDHVGGLKLATKNSQAETPAYLAISQFYEADYKTEKDFKAKQDEGVDNNYYVRVANDQDMLKIALETNESGAAVAVTKYEGTAVPEDSETGETIILTSNMAEDIELNVAKNASANIFKIEITAPDGVSKSTYYVFVQRMAVAGIKLNYGNSPYGMIMADDTISSEIAGQDEEGVDRTGKELAKIEFNKLDRFTDQYVPVSARPGSIFGKAAWGDSEDPTVNMDRNEYAIFVYNRESFRDPGFEAIDSAGNPVDAEKITRTIRVDRASAIGLSMGNLEDDNVTSETITITGVESKYLFEEVTVEDRTVAMIRPGVYEMEYSFEDEITGETVTTKRYVIVLATPGDTDLSEEVNSSDQNNVISAVAGNSPVEGLTNEALVNLYTYRILDVDMSAEVNSSDVNPIQGSVAGTEIERAYNQLS